MSLECLYTKRVVPSEKRKICLIVVKETRFDCLNIAKASRALDKVIRLHERVHV